MPLLINEPPRQLLGGKLAISHHLAVDAHAPIKRDCRRQKDETQRTYDVATAGIQPITYNSSNLMLQAPAARDLLTYHSRYSYLCVTKTMNFTPPWMMEDLLEVKALSEDKITHCAKTIIHGFILYMYLMLVAVSLYCLIS